MATNSSFTANQTSGPGGNFSSGLDTTDSGEEELQQWHVYFLSVFIGIICGVGILGNIIAIRNASTMLKYSKQNSIISCSLSTSDFLVCLVRGPSLIYVLFHLRESNGRIVCEIWMFSTIFVMTTILTNMVVAIERHMIVHSFHSYVKLFTPRNMVLLLVALWFAIASIFTAVYLGFGYDAVILTDARTCVVRSNESFITGWGSFIISLICVLVFGFAPVFVITFCYVSIVNNICKAGLLKLDKLEEKVNYTRVTYVSCARAFLMLVCWTPFLICVVIVSLYPDTLVSRMQYVDYILIIQSALCPYLTLQDNDFKEAFSRRKSRYLTVFLSAKREVKPTRQSNISSADMKTM